MNKVEESHTEEVERGKKQTSGPSRQTLCTLPVLHGVDTQNVESILQGRISKCKRDISETETRFCRRLRG